MGAPPGALERGPDRRVAALLAVLVGALYALGAAPTIYVGDSGELVAAAYLLGVPHPTGYPLYAMLGKLWMTVWPFGSIAYRMSLFSAACAALAVGLLFLVCRRLGLSRTASVTASLLLAFSPSFWAEANVQRVYALNAVFVVLATGFTAAWHRSRRPRDLTLALFVSALGATNHTVMACTGLALVIFVLATEARALLTPRRAAAALGAVLLGLLPYAYLPLASRADPPLDWGDPETLAGFLDVVLRRSFWQRAWAEGPLDVLVAGGDFLLSLGKEFLWAGTALAAVGLWAGWKRRLPVLLWVLVMGLNFLAVALHGSRSDIFVWHRYYIPAYTMLALLAGVGAEVLVERLPRALRLAPLLVPSLLLVLGWRSFDRSRFRIAEDFAGLVLGSLPPGAHLIASDDNVLFTLIYLHLVEGRRPDVDLVLQGVGASELPPLSFDPDRDALCFTHHPNWRVPGLEVVPVGVVFRAVRAGRAPPAAAVAAAALAGEHDRRVPKDYLTRNLIGHFHYMLGVTFEERDWPRAHSELQRAAEASPGNDVLFYNLGLIYARNGLYDQALAAFRRAQAINPRHLASGSRPRPAERVAEVEAERERVLQLEAALSGDPRLGGLAGGSADDHRRMAELLRARGEAVAARGHELRAREQQQTQRTPAHPTHAVDIDNSRVP